ncbi:hypothetical protein CRG98_045113 [Punica granatum]|uniref:Protein kinase domain-containing protein n=1 Tax=Punica granatum TaxID=22663 RepID=A0A2I0HS01_PUNGR|nr:hypothetical protein CRG98_045113 [Punica granatum]
MDDRFPSDCNSLSGCCFGFSSRLVSRAVWFATRKCKEESDKEQDRPVLPHHFFTEFTDSPSNRGSFFDLGSILAATNNFPDKLKLGEGGFGPVYKGVLRDGTEVAVKRLQEIFSEQGSEEFNNEVMLIMKLQHNNPVRLLGFWAEEVERLLVYEYMPNSSLDVFLFGECLSSQAKGILYLHEDSWQRIIHRDLKASNILLDADMNPKISDFGIARIFAGAEGAANHTTIIGKYGYMAPEYAMEGLYSVKSDVYSFGVLLLEIVTGKRNAGFSSSKLGPSLPAYAWQTWNVGKALQLMNSLLHGSCPTVEFIRCVHVGLLCVQEDMLDRPTVSAALVMLKKDAVILPQIPAFSTCQFNGNFVSSDAGGSATINGLTISNVMPRYQLYINGRLYLGETCLHLSVMIFL